MGMRSEQTNSHLNNIHLYLEGTGELEGRPPEGVAEVLRCAAARGAAGPAADTGLAEVGRPLASGPPPWPQGLCCCAPPPLSPEERGDPDALYLPGTAPAPEARSTCC